MANTMSDTNEQNRTGFNEQTENERFVPGVSNDNQQTNAKKCRRRLKLAVYVCMILMVIADVWALVAYPSLPSHFTKPSGSRESSSKISDNTKESTCTYYTDREYWKSIPDDLNEYCTPKAVKAGPSGVVLNMHPCLGTSPQLYIPLFCLCDYNVTCPHTNNSSASNELSRKRSCKECTAENHCPCQNFGKCYVCMEKKSSSLKCMCQPGTNGTYCTKISKRLCTKSEESNGLPNCNMSNDIECFLRLNDHGTYICKWKEAMNGDYSSCGVSISAMNNMKGGMPNSEGIEHSEAPQPTKILLWVKLLLLVVVIILCSILKFRDVKHLFIKKCRRKNSGLAQS